jgi:hypothetical protein
MNGVPSQVITTYSVAGDGATFTNNKRQVVHILAKMRLTSSTASTLRSVLDYSRQ